MLSGAQVRRNMPRTISGAGTFTITDLPKLDAYSRIHFFASGAIIDKVKVQVDSLDVWELTTAMHAAFLARTTPKLVAQTNCYHVCFDLTQQGDSVLPMVYGNGRPVSDLRLDVTCNAAGSFDIFTETVGRPD